MAAPRRVLIVGNWKMNGSRQSKQELEAMVKGLNPAFSSVADIMVCPPAILLAELAGGAVSPIRFGGQDCHHNASGAHTGDISAEMLKESGADSVILGHSERRADHGEGDAIVHAKVKAAWRAGLLPIVCVGETLEQRDADEAAAVVARQVRQSIPEGATGENLVVAYEPIWAIGTGRTPTPEDVAQVHASIRHVLNERFGEEGEKIRILYGGSVKPENAKTLLAVANVDGALVGGASLKAEDFLGIAHAAL
ncbi:triose-phosphate isomerase [Xanthobacter sp. TB0139]|uniref:triose-phosphate isomerase n=1 Tax=Xanthobacter sp. TB0139 TaxID=3459178 RepID=UPI004039A765